MQADELETEKKWEEQKSWTGTTYEKDLLIRQREEIGGSEIAETLSIW